MTILLLLCYHGIYLRRLKIYYAKLTAISILLEKKMIKSNIYKPESPLEIHQDDRGVIADVFYNQRIDHVAVVDSYSGKERGNHYHKETTQHIYITKGQLEYWYKTVGSDNPPKYEIANVGDVISTPPMEIHTLRITQDNQFVVFSEGLRGGKDYEKDTYRIGYSLLPKHEGIDTKLHLGCGNRFLPGYIHVDIATGDHIDYCHDIKKLPMFSDESASVIYSCGSIVYFDREEVLAVLHEWKRILQPDGWVYISVPNFDSIIKVYNQNKILESKGILGPLFGKWKFENEYIYQKTVYNFISLEKILIEAGFQGIELYEWQDFLPERYDDYSMAYIPHMNKSGIPLCLNVRAMK